MSPIGYSFCACWPIYTDLIDPARSSSLSLLKSLNVWQCRPSVSVKTSKSTALLTSSTMSLSEEPSGCLPEWVCLFKLPSSLSKMVCAAFSALHTREIADSVRLGPKFLIPCLTKLLLCSMSSSRGIFPPFTPWLFTNRFQMNCSLSLFDNKAWTKKNWYYKILSA